MLDKTCSSEFAQGLKEAVDEMGEILPHCWWLLYTRCISKGFSGAQAMTLTNSFVLAQNFSGSATKQETSNAG